MAPIAPWPLWFLLVIRFPWLLRLPGPYAPYPWLLWPLWLPGSYGSLTAVALIAPLGDPPSLAARTPWPLWRLWLPGLYGSSW